MIKHGSCINPQTALVQGTFVFYEQFKATEARISQELNGRGLVMFNSYKVFDSQDSERSIKTRMTWDLRESTYY